VEELMTTRQAPEADDSWLHAGNATFLEDLYQHYLNQPEHITESWRNVFDNQFAATQLEQVISNNDHTHQPTLPAQRPLASSTPSKVSVDKQAAVLRLINTYRYQGHQIAHLDPLQAQPLPVVPELQLAYHRLTEDDLAHVFYTGSLYAPRYLPLHDIVQLVHDIYCRTVGCEYLHLTKHREQYWLQKRIESYRTRPELTAADRRWILTMLTAAEGLEHYLHARFAGQKRFSLEGAETLIPMLDELIQRAGRHQAREVVIGMAHRGRLNVLVNIVGKPLQEVLAEFNEQAAWKAEQSAGDVKYHLGYATDLVTPGGLVHVVLGFNPSHLEIIDPVIEGSVRARQRRCGDRDGSQVIPVLIHGDSAFAGQGVVMETLQLSQTRGHSTGGTVHIIINNQIGFTTSNPLDTRSSLYCTDVAKMVQGPIFHVNGDDPEAAIFVTRLALDFRRQFKRDVFIDLVCYRRLGHNEADEPAVTQPVMYQKIRAHQTTRAQYAQHLIANNDIDQATVADLSAAYQQDALHHGVVNQRPVVCAVDRQYRVDWARYQHSQWDMAVATGVADATLSRLAKRLLDYPEALTLHARIEKLWAERTAMAEQRQPIDWGFAELLAYATLLDAGYPVRLTGQDSGRGTFFHRHARIYCQQSGQDYVPLQHLNAHQAPFVVIDSILSEEAVLGFEYGFATAEPQALTLWEAQFGDFANCAQVVIDQFITAAGVKWGLACGLVMLLPHGHEGQGAEHSSARLERYLQLCADHNMQVVNPTTPAQIFHVLRRQVLRPYRRPLIVLTPKSLLRHPAAVSTWMELSTGTFLPILVTKQQAPELIQRVIFCSGKLYSELWQQCQQQELQHIAFIRIEQIYPFPTEALRACLQPYHAVKTWLWCQEEPANQGAWTFIQQSLCDCLPAGAVVHYCGRPISAVPASGYRRIHDQQQQQLITEALTNN
jgi:2-oxoglutarate dehydrogenase E1 component